MKGPAVRWFTAMVVFAFISIISFFQIDSAWADAHKFNTGWLVIGIVAGVAAVFCLWKASTKTTGHGG